MPASSLQSLHVGLDFVPAFKRPFEGVHPQSNPRKRWFGLLHLSYFDASVIHLVPCRAFPPESTFFSRWRFRPRLKLGPLVSASVPSGKDTRI